MCLGIPGKILEVEEGPLRMGRVTFDGVVKEVSLAFVPEAVVGEFVVAHAGTAIEVIDEEAAARVLETFRALLDSRGEAG
jgi:hydrogenase expression/formation protein HypC